MKARIRREAPGLWVVEAPGRSPRGARTWAGAFELLEHIGREDDYWRRQDPLADRPAETPAPRPWRRWLMGWA